MNVMGIDPGMSGGIAVITPNQTYAFKMPDSEDGIANLLEELSMDIDFCLLEDQHSRPDMASQAVWTFAQHFGYLKAVLRMLKIPRDAMTPQNWMKVLGIPKRRKIPTEETHTEFKNRLKAKAIELFPQIKVTLYVADALLIAETARRMRAGV